MKLYFILIFAAIAMAFGSGNLALSLKSSLAPTQEDISQIDLIKTRFEDEGTPITRIDLRSVYHTRYHLELIHDQTETIPDGPKHDDRIDYASKNDCFKNLKYVLTPRNYKKVTLWEEFRCQRRSSLPSNFFAEPDFIHPSGNSYAFLAYLTKRAPFITQEWIRSNLSVFKISELEKLTETIGPIGGVFGILATLTDAELASLAIGKNFTLTKNYCFTKIGGSFISTSLRYAIYLRDDFENYLRETPFTITPFSPNNSCFFRDNNFCWQYNTAYVFKKSNMGHLIFFFSSLFITALIVWIILNKLQVQKLEEERKKLALHVLSHEFRTPVANLLLQAEEIQKHFDSLPLSTQDPFLMIQSEIYRLQRLTQMSKNYLYVTHHNKLINFKPQKIDSLAEYLESIIVPNVGTSDYIFFNIENDISFIIDPYWPSIAIKNLIVNSSLHGKPPITITAKIVEKNKNLHLSIAVSDMGMCQFSDIDELTTEFVKGSESIGSGLGLNIVKKIVEEMSGELLFAKNPTTFTITLPQTKLKESGNNE